MSYFDIDEFLNFLKFPHSANEYSFEPTQGTTTPLSSDSTGTPLSSLTEEDAAHIDNLVFFGIDSPVLPPDIQTSRLATTEMTPSLESMIPQSFESDVSPLPVSSSLFSPPITDAPPSSTVSRLAHRRCDSLFNPMDQSHDPTPGPSAPRLPSNLAGQAVRKPSSRRPDYSACRCPGYRFTSNRARHWRSCPYNPERRAKRFTCEICGTKFTREDNKKRHIEDYHLGSSRFGSA